MAQRRMFNKSITNSSKFLKMPMSSRLLYYDLGMNADDDGFVEHFMVLRMTGATEQDLGVLEINGLVKVFDENVLWIKDWKENNYIPKDRYQQSKYLQLYTIEDYIEIEEKEKKPLSYSQQKRLEAKKESDLPSSFENQIRNAFNGKICPVCKKTMNFERDIDNPSIQHNIPISLGGKHEIDNISVICKSCNCSIQNREITPPYNTEEVKKIWECIGNVSTGKDSIGKYSIGNKEEIYKEESEKKEIFEEIWKMYPKKRGKDNAYKDFVKSLKQGTTVEEIKDGLENYLKYIEIEKKEERYIKDGSTWFHQHCWKDDYTVRKKLTTKDLASKIDFSDVL